jgi:hypothetical protein
LNFSDVKEPDIDMFGPLVKGWILHQGDGALVIAVQASWLMVHTEFGK